MTKEERAKYLAMPSKGYVSAFNGLEVKDFEYGVTDYVIFIADAWRGKPTVHRARVYYTSERPFFTFEAMRVYLDEVIRC